MKAMHKLKTRSEMEIGEDDVQTEIKQNVKMEQKQKRNETNQKTRASLGQLVVKQRRRGV